MFVERHFGIPWCVEVFSRLHIQTFIFNFWDRTTIQIHVFMVMPLWHICDRYNTRTITFTTKAYWTRVWCFTSLVFAKTFCWTFIKHQTMLDNIVWMEIMMLVKLFFIKFPEISNVVSLDLSVVYPVASSYFNDNNNRKNNLEQRNRWQTYSN